MNQHIHQVFSLYTLENQMMEKRQMLSSQRKYNFERYLFDDAGMEDQQNVNFFQEFEKFAFLLFF